MDIISREDYILRTQEPLDHGMLRYPHGISNTERARMVRRFCERVNENKRNAQIAGQEYDQLSAEGKIRPPTRNERLIQIARGHEDNASVQAARRLCEKHGIQWSEE